MTYDIHVNYTISQGLSDGLWDTLGRDIKEYVSMQKCPECNNYICMTALSS